MRKLNRPGERTGPDVEYLGVDEAHAAAGPDGPRWIIRSHAIARELIRDERTVGQAGFGAMTFNQLTDQQPTDPASSPNQSGPSEDSGPVRRFRRRQAGAEKLRPPVLYLEGPEHRSRRKAAARFFTPKVVDSYEPMITELSEQLVGPLSQGKQVDVSRLSMKLAVTVAARVIGLTSSVVPGMSNRLQAFFDGDLLEKVRTPAALVRKLRTSTAMLRFYYLDVIPAIRVRRRHPSDDLISQLLELGFRPMEILTEAITYGAAGMVTTREFITVCTWHLLDDPELLERFRTGGHEERVAVLSEILRLEPVIGHLFRQVTAATSLTVAGIEHELPRGTMIDLDVRAINADAELVGAEPLALCPARPLATRGTAPSVMSFGDGHHRCPGGPMAILETEIFLTTLLDLDLVADGPPTVGWSDLTQGYDLRRLMVRRRAR